MKAQILQLPSPMMKDLVRLFIILGFLAMAACNSNSHLEVPTRAQEVEVPVTPEVKSTRQPKRPTIVKDQGYQIARGATKLYNMQAHFDDANKTMQVKGEIEFIPAEGDNDQEVIQVSLSGKLDSEGFINLKADASMPIRDGLVVGAKATCLTEAGTCYGSFIDIYLYTFNVVYHHQVESHQAAPVKPNASPKQETPKTPAPPIYENPNLPAVKGETEFEGTEHTEEELGPYVGTIYDDIRDILNVLPQTPVEPEAEPTASPSPSPAATPTPSPSPTSSATPQPSVTPSPRPTATPTASPKPAPEKEGEDDKKEIEVPKEIPIPQTRPENLGQGTQPTTPNKPAPQSRVSQAIGPANDGRLENATNVYNIQLANKALGFQIIRPFRQTHFATNEIAYIIKLIGEETNKLVPNYKVAIGDLSKENGGSLGNHKSHTNGLDADIGFYFTNKSFQGYFASATAVNKPHASWMVEEQWTLFKKLVATQLVDRIFIHETLKKEICQLAIKNGEISKDTTEGVNYQTLRRLIADQDHNTHFHLRVKCSSAQIRCRQMAEPRSGTGCF